MKRILVLGLGNLANGDITVAAEILREGYKRHFEVLFLCHPDRAPYLLSLGFEAESLTGSSITENREQFYCIVKRWKPDALLCADVYTLEYSKKWSGIDLELLKKTGIPLGSTDQYERESVPEFIDTLLSVSFRYHKSYIIDCDFLIRPCPLNKPLIATSGNICCCRLFSALPPSPTLAREQWCRELNILPGRKVIFYANSAWEYTFRMKDLLHWIPRMIHEYCASTSVPLQIIHVGPYPWQFEINPGIQYTYINNMRRKAYLFLDTIAHADLFLSTSLVNTSLSYAIYYQTPSIVLQNSKVIRFSDLRPIMHTMPPWYRQMADEVKEVGRFSMFPWGWYNFLTALFAQNSYVDCLVKAPVFEPGKTVSLIRSYLTDTSLIDDLKRRQREYFKTLEDLPPVHRFIDQL